MHRGEAVGAAGRAVRFHDQVAASGGGGCVDGAAAGGGGAGGLGRADAGGVSNMFATNSLRSANRFSPYPSRGRPGWRTVLPSPTGNPSPPNPPLAGAGLTQLRNDYIG